jgi:AraC-like DNA-binding protein
MIAHDKTPTLLVNQSFNSIDHWSQAIGWDMDFRQIEPGLLNARAVGFGHAGIMVMRVELNSSFHQLGSPPSGFQTFGLPDKESGTLRWSGAETPPGVLINFSYEEELDCVNQGPMGGYVFSFSEDTLNRASETLGLDSGFIGSIQENRFWAPHGNEHEQLRQVLRALERVAVCDGDEGLEQWGEVFNTDLVTLVVRILAMDSSAARLVAPSFRLAALSRALKILSEHDQPSLSIEALCTMVGASWATLERAFKDEFGMAPKQYIKSKRLSAVKSELIKTGPDAVISNVAHHWGFQHMSSFAKDYRKQFGELPSETLGHLK